jgi:hypothetical protein
MAHKTKTKKTVKATAVQTEYDSVYFLKILLYLILGSVWGLFGGHRELPIGLLLGLAMVQHESLQIDRKIEYAVLLIAAVLGLVGIGIGLAL